MAPGDETALEKSSVGHQTPVGARTVMLVGAAMVGLFGAMALWSVSGTPVPHVPTTGTVEAPAPDDSEMEGFAPAGEVSRSGDPQTPLEAGKLVLGRKIASLLAQRFEHRRSDGTTGFATMRSALAPGKSVTILNVWATYCEPCKREFPGFRALQPGWGGNVRFLPVQLGEGDATELRSVMPVAPSQLVDYIPGGAVQKEIAKLGLLPSTASIPVTVLIDCREEVRWVQQGEVEDMQAFDGAVKTLVAELRTPKCAGQSDGPTSRPAPARAVDACKNRCKPGQTCTRRFDGTYHCLDDLE